MNMNDPFGRMETQRERDYESLCRSLQKAGLTNRADAQALVDKLGKRVKIGLLVIVPTTLALALLLPELRIVVLAAGALAGLWLVNATRRGQAYVERFMREELSDEGESETF